MENFKHVLDTLVDKRISIFRPGCVITGILKCSDFPNNHFVRNFYFISYHNDEISLLIRFINEEVESVQNETIVLKNEPVVSTIMGL